MTDTNKLMQESWQARNVLYSELWGNYASVSPSDYQAPAGSELLRSPPSDTGNPQDNSQALAILSYAPDPMRHYWTYVTAGLSNPWFQEEPQEVSGFGCEIMIKTPQEESWPQTILRSMAFHVFNSVGTLSPGSLVRLNAPISHPKGSELDSLFVWYADEAPEAWYQLPSGGFGLFAAIGITDDECKFAESIKEYGTWCIQSLLRQVGIGQITDYKRQSAMKDENIASIKQSIVNYAENFRPAT